ncbi:ANTAR domain-containing protein [Streptomyces sp. NPDC052114]|uniref:ANTAR domain-containing protein n=1 Tax=unclassified Streptomyces TaxID=2593676 RepID=UPI00344476E5
MTPPEQRLAEVFVDLAGASLSASAEGAGVLDLLARYSVELLDGCAAAAVRAGRADGVETAGSEPAVGRLELAAAGWREGPGHDCESANSPVRYADVTEPVVRTRWPRYTAGAKDLGHRWVTALPLRTADEPPGAGALTLLGPAPLGPGALALGQSLADAAAISLERSRLLDESRVLVGQLEHALVSRVFIEQAKGALSVRLAVPPDEAFALLRGHARAGRRRLNDVAQDVISGRLALGQEDSAAGRESS